MLTIREIIKTFYNALLQRFKKYRGNWEQNDPNADDYIKNRPFYSEFTNVIVKNIVSGQLNGFPLFKIGDTVTVNVDGVKYSLVAYDDWGPTIGDTHDSLENGEGKLGWQIYIWNESVLFYSIKAHTVSYFGEKIVKFDKKYLPENLATKSEVETVQISANRAQAAAESAQTTANNNKETLSTIFAPSVFSFTFDKQTSGRPYFHFNHFTYYKISDFAPAPEDVISFIGTNENGENSSKITVGNNCAEYGCFIVVTSAGTCSLPIGGSIYALYPKYTGLYARYPEFNNKQAAGTGKFILQINSSWPANSLLLKSSNPNSTKKFQITVDDNGALTATEVTA